MLTEDQVMQVERLLGRAHHRRLAEQLGVPEETILQIWRDFRLRFKIPAMLL